MDEIVYCIRMEIAIDRFFRMESEHWCCSNQEYEANKYFSPKQITVVRLIIFEADLLALDDGVGSTRL